MWGHNMRATMSRGLPINANKSIFRIYATAPDAKRTLRDVLLADKTCADLGMAISITQSA
eukprot:3518127-Pyramimonas_sp.AAC.1